MDLRSSFMVACVRWILVRMRQKNPLGNGSGRCGKRKVFRRRTSPWPVILTGHTSAELNAENGTSTLDASELIRRFSLHILPSGLVRIRHYGILGNNRRKRAIEAARAIFKCRGRTLVLHPQGVVEKPICCPLCGKAGIRLVAFSNAAGVLHMIAAGPMPCDSS